jgi:hypothetical protein
MQISTQQEKAIIEAVISGRCRKKDIRPPRNIRAFFNEGKGNWTVDGKEMNQESFDKIKAELAESDSIRDELGLPPHQITSVYFVSYSEPKEQKSNY